MTVENILIYLIVMKSIASLARNIALFSTLKTLPSSYNPNISLISNIGKTKQLSSLLALHQSLQSKFTEKHLAQAARKMPQLMKSILIEGGKGQKIMLKKQDEESLKNFLKRIANIDFTLISAQQFLNFTVFLQKIVKFKRRLEPYSAEIVMIETRLKEKLQQYFDRVDLQLFNFIQVCSLLNSFSMHLTYTQLIRLMKHISGLLSHKQHCSCFHMAILCQMLNEINQKQQEFGELKNGIQQICYKQVTFQLQVARTYMNCRNLIQIYNAFFPNKKEEISYLLPHILSQMKTNFQDTSMFNKFFEKDLNNFKVALAQVKPSSIVQQLQKLISIGISKQRQKQTVLPIGNSNPQQSLQQKLGSRGFFKGN